MWTFKFSTSGLAEFSPELMGETDSWSNPLNLMKIQMG